MESATLAPKSACGKTRKLATSWQFAEAPSARQQADAVRNITQPQLGSLVPSTFRFGTIYLGYGSACPQATDVVFSSAFESLFRAVNDQMTDPHCSTAELPALLVLLAVCLGALLRRLPNRRADHVSPSTFRQTVESAQVLGAHDSDSEYRTHEKLNAARLAVKVLKRDVNQQLQQLQARDLWQTETINKLSEGLDIMNGQINDIQELLAALEGASSKQFQLILRTLAKQQA